MTRQIPRQYWKYYNAENLADFYISNAWTQARKTDAFYGDTLHTIIMEQYQEAEGAITKLDDIRNQVLIESLGTMVSGGLETKIATDENDIISDEQLLAFAHPTTQQQYKEQKLITERLIQIYSILRDHYTTFFDMYEQAIHNLEAAQNSSSF